MPRCARRALTPLVFAVLATTSANAQQADSTATPAPRTWLTSFTLFMPRLPDGGDASFVGIGGTATPAEPNRLGPDLGLFIVPRGVQAGVLLGSLRANLGVPIAISPDMRLIPSAGLTLIGAVGAIGAGGARGFNGTLALHAYPRANGDSDGRTGGRVAVGVHQFSGTSSRVWLLEVGVARR